MVGVVFICYKEVIEDDKLKKVQSLVAYLQQGHGADGA